VPGLSQKYLPSVNYGRHVRNVLRKDELASFVGKDVIVHYSKEKTDSLKLYAVEGPFLFLIAQKSSLGHIALEIAKWDFTLENGTLHAYPKSGFK
jgi:hypothetical protein